MTSIQEELNQKFPADRVPLTDCRYSVVWYNKADREIVLVYDKVLMHVVYKGNSKIRPNPPEARKDHYPHIQKFYGKHNCDPPKQVNPQQYEGL